MALSYVLAAISLTGLFLVSRTAWLGWLILTITELAWIAWCAAIDQGALALLFTAYFALYALNLYRSTNKEAGEA